MARIKIKIDSRDSSEISADRVYLTVNGKEYTFIDRNGKLEICCDEPLKITLGSGCNLIYLEQEK